jgi:tripartite-type tricarboxylate transporter receptor subunit TctC
MTLSSRQLGLILSGAVLPVIGRAQADSYPQRPIKVVVPFGPGSAVDVVARITAPHMSQLLGQPLVIDDRPGATGAIGADYVAKSSPNGYTLVLGTVASHATLAATQPDLPYNIERDFEPIALLDQLLDDRGGQSVGSGHQPEEVCRLDQGAAQAGQLRIGRDRRGDPSCD